MINDAAGLTLRTDAGRISMTNRWGCLARGTIMLLLICAAAGRTQEERDDRTERTSTVYLRSPEDRLSRLSSTFNLGQRRKDNIRRILNEVDAGVRQKISAGNKKIRALLSEDDKDVFDNLRDDTEGGPPSRQTTRRLTPTPHLDTGGGSGGRGGGGGGRGGGGSGGEMSGQGGGTRGRCGDGVCGSIEKTRGACPEDCGQSQEQPAQ